MNKLITVVTALIVAGVFVVGCGQDADKKPAGGSGNAGGAAAQQPSTAEFKAPHSADDIKAALAAIPVSTAPAAVEVSKELLDKVEAAKVKMKEDLEKYLADKEDPWKHFKGDPKYGSYEMVGKDECRKAVETISSASGSQESVLPNTVKFILANKVPPTIRGVLEKANLDTKSYAALMEQVGSARAQAKMAAGTQAQEAAVAARTRAAVEADVEKMLAVMADFKDEGKLSILQRSLGEKERRTGTSDTPQTVRVYQMIADNVKAVDAYKAAEHQRWLQTPEGKKAAKEQEKQDKVFRSAYTKGKNVRKGLLSNPALLKMREKGAIAEGLQLAADAGVPQEDRDQYAQQYSLGMSGVSSQYGEGVY